MGLIKAVIQKHAVNDHERNVKFGLTKRNVYFGTTKRVGAHCLVIQCDEKHSGHLQRVLVRAQQEKGFGNTMKFTPFGFTGTIGVDNYKNILRRQNEYGVNTKALPLYHVDKVKLGKLLNNKSNGTNMLQKLNELKLITGVESIMDDREETVYFMGPDHEPIKKGLRQHVLPLLLQNSDKETHMGRHQYDDVPQEDIERLADHEDAEFKHYDDD